MKIRIFVALTIMGYLYYGASLFAQDSAVAPKIEWTAMAALEEGQYIKSDYSNGPMSFRPWLTDEYARLGIEATINQHFSVTIIPQIELWNDTWDWILTSTPISEYYQINELSPLTQHATVTLADAEGIYSFGSTDAVALNIAAGVIPYKYDEEARNLGEYLFRTGEHPAYIFNSFDQAYVTLTGFRANAEIFRNLSLDLFFTTETQVEPMNDWSLSLLAGYKLPGYLDVGAGVMFDRLIPAVSILDKQTEGLLGTYYTSTGQLDTFSWGGTKVMAHAAFDPKELLPADFPKIFGKEDGIFYGEAAILGLQNVTPYMHPLNPNNGQPDLTKLVVDSEYDFYSNIKQRIPVMFGFNFPTFKLLDYLSVELEWYGDPYAPGLYTEEGFKYFFPLPNGSDPTISHWKYSFNVKKSVGGNLSLIGQIARDHTRDDAYYITNYDEDEIFQTKDEWGWWLKLQCNI
jgi:hypothetical protein